MVNVTIQAPPPINKKVLILGNGFDLAHGLPTRYSDFLGFCNALLNGKRYRDIWDKITKYLYMNNGEKYISDYFHLFCCIQNNIWCIYLNDLYKNNAMKGENWIDFESEIRAIIETIDRNVNNITYSYRDVANAMNNNSMDFPEKIQRFNVLLKNNYSVKDVRKILYNDLEKLIWALEIYLSFVDVIPIRLKSPDISDSYNYIINFNYTNTYQSVYSEWANSFHIHGEINKKPNNMVLGIDEYWSEEERDEHTNFTIFKKFAQRIQKRTGIESYKWFEEIKKLYQINNNNIASVYIFGHSLDVTDKDILFDYLNDDATDVTIFCRDKETEGEYIANIIKIIGEKRLLEKVNQYPPKLKFVIQQDMIPIEEKELSTSGAAT